MRWSYRTPAGQLFRAVRAVDTATHPAYQRRGIFSTLTRQAITDLTEEGVHFIFNTPNQRSLPGYLKLGWQVVATWPLYVKPLRPVRMGIRRLGLGAGPPPVEQFEAFFGPGLVPWPVFFDRYGEATGHLVDIWESRRTQAGLRTPRTLDYLQWRYGQHPHQTYGVCPYETPAGLAGFAVVRPNVRYGWQEIVVTDIFLAESSPQAGRSLLKNLAGQAKGDYLVAHFAEKTLEQTLLKQNGFFRLPRQGMTFTVRALNLPWPDIVDPGNWDLTLGDLEVF
jgi:GNAT superfamily N-acetyltransferase